MYLCIGTSGRERPHISVARVLRHCSCTAYRRAVTIELRPLTRADAAAHCAGEDEETVRWLTGGYGTVEGTAAYFDWLAGNAAAGSGKRGFGVWLQGAWPGTSTTTPTSETAWKRVTSTCPAPYILGPAGAVWPSRQSG